MTSFAFYLFIVIAALMIITALAWIGPRLFSASKLEPDVDEKTSNLLIYQDESARLADEFSDGRISEEEFEKAQAELRRRMLSEIDEESNDPKCYPLSHCLSAPTRKAGMIVMGLIPVLAIGLYLHIGNIQMFAVMNNESDDQQSASQHLRAHLATNPNDARAWVFLGRSEMEANRFHEAAIAFEKAINTSGKVANDATVLCELAEAIGMGQGGTFRGRPNELVKQALELAPGNPVALEMGGSAAYEIHDYETAARYWRTLREMLNPESRAYQELSIAIARAEAEPGAQTSAAVVESTP